MIEWISVECVVNVQTCCTFQLIFLMTLIYLKLRQTLTIFRSEISQQIDIKSIEAKSLFS